MVDFVAATFQQQVKIYSTPLEYQADIFQLLQIAQARQARIVVLPALSPLMLIPPLTLEDRLNQAKTPSAGRRNFAGLMDRLLGKPATAKSKEAFEVKDKLRYLLEHYPGEIYDAYIDLFSAAALKHQMTIVAGSFYLREHEEADCTHSTYVFGPNGMILGRQAKLHLTPQEKTFCQPGNGLQIIETPVGKLGILIEEDVLYPECGRILAYQGADLLVNMAACSGATAFNQLRHAFLARIDENVLPGIQSSLVGDNLMAPHTDTLLGKAAILYPFRISPTGDGILEQTSHLHGDGFVSRTLNLETFKNHWVEAEHPLRKEMRMDVYKSLTKVYRETHTLDHAYWHMDTDTPSENLPSVTSKPSQIPPTDRKTASQQVVSPFAQDED